MQNNMYVLHIKKIDKVGETTYQNDVLFDTEQDTDRAAVLMIHSRGTRDKLIFTDSGYKLKKYNGTIEYYDIREQY